jgi:predicted dehydrogenase
MERYRIDVMSRREFLQESALTAAALGAGSMAYGAESEARGASDRSAAPLKIGIIGPGSQGQNDLRKVIKVPGIECVAVCDIFEPNLNEAKQIAHVTDDNAYVDYRRLLDRKDIHAVMVTVPITLHAKITIDALEAGKHVFCEKLMAYTVEDAKRMALTAKRTGKVLQIGHHRSSSIGYNHAYEMLNTKKVCGRVTHIRAQWNRNGAWRRSIPEGKVLGGMSYWHDMEHLVNWRLYNRTSQGLMAELGSHQVQVVNWFLGAAPTAVTGVGGLDYWKDGRDIWDNVQCIYEYPHGVKLTYQSLTTNQFDGFQEEFMGDKGTLITTLGDHNEDKGLLYREPKAETLDWAQFTEKEKRPDGKVGIVLNAAATKKLNTGAKIGEQTLSTGGEGKDAYDIEFYNWAAAIRQGGKNYCDPMEGLRAAVAIIKANEAMAKQTRIVITPDTYQI